MQLGNTAHQLGILEIPLSNLEYYAKYSYFSITDSKKSSLLTKQIATHLQEAYLVLKEVSDAVETLVSDDSQLVINEVRLVVRSYINVKQRYESILTRYHTAEQSIAHIAIKELSYAVS